MAVTTTWTIRDRASAALGRIADAYNRVDRAARAVNANVREMERAQDYGAAHIRAAAEEADRLLQKQSEVDKSGTYITASWGRIKQLIAGVKLGGAIQKTLALADTMAQTAARLELINDGLQTTAQLQEKIFASANRSRAAYSDVAQTVAKLGVLAGDAFGSNDEIIRFAELMNKNFVVGGSSQQEKTAATGQIIKAMADGKLQADGVGALMENAPIMAQAIADFTGKSKGELQKMSAEGAITADIIKGAMFASAEDIETRFAKMPMTFSQVFTVVGNVLLKTFLPVIQAIGRGAQWLYDNWDRVTPVLAGVAAAVLIFAAATAIWTAVTWLQVAANRALLASMAANPILWIALAIGVVVGLIYKWVQSVGGLQVAWLIVCDAVLSAWDKVKIGFLTGVAFVQNVLDAWGLAFLMLKAAILDTLGDLKAGVLTGLQGIVNGAIGIINTFIEALNKIPGVSIDLIDQVTFGTTAQLEHEAAKQARARELAEETNAVLARADQRNAELVRMQAEAEAEHRMRQLKITEAKYQSAQEKTSAGTEAWDDYDGVTNVGKVEEVGRVNGDVSIADEDIRFLRDVAEMRFVQNFVTLTPTVSMNAQISERVDVDEVVHSIERTLEEEFAAEAEGVYA